MKPSSLIWITCLSHVITFSNCLNTTLTASGITVAIAASEDHSTALAQSALSTGISSGIVTTTTPTDQAGQTGFATPLPAVSGSDTSSPLGYSGNGTDPISGPGPMSNTSTYVVHVGGNNTLTFSPDQIAANVGDVIQFIFHATNHTLSESTLDAPCEAMLDGFNSGFHQPNPANNNGTMLAFTVTSLAPRFFFCDQYIPVPHCESGMVFALNAGDSLNPFFAKVISLGTMTNIGSTLIQTFTNSLSDGRVTTATSTSINLPKASLAIATVSLPTVSLASRQNNPELLRSQANSIGSIRMQALIWILACFGLLFWFW